jgi:type II secretory pathway component GspD/PulD (secretin)
VTFSAPPVSSTLTAVSGSEISGNLLGLVRADNLLTVFNAFLAKDNDVRTLHKPFIATTTGVPAAYSQFDKQYVNIISENTATSTAGATVSRSNNLIPFEFGINLRIAPRLDPKTKTIRASISLVQILQSGFTEVQQFVTDSAGARPVITRIPLDRRVEIQGDALLNDGDLIVIGGAMSVNEADDSSGFPGLKDIPGLSYVFGNRTSNDAVSTYYFALHVKKKPMS